MKYRVNDNCIACGMCTSICPAVFSMSDEGHAEAIQEDVVGQLEACAQEEAESCPVDAIEAQS
jgi:ferredoxin